MSVTDWLRNLWRDPRTQEVIRQVIVALLLALLSVLGYDQAVAQPRVEASEAQMQMLEMRVSGCEIGVR